MRRRDRRDDEVVDVNEQPEAARMAPPVANVLALQQTAGNHAVANLLRPRAAQLMRDRVDGKATWQSQRHHPDYEFDFGGDNKVQPHFDKWYSEPLKGVGPLGHAQTVTANTVQGILAGYNGTGSIVDGIVDALISANPLVPDTMGKPDTDQLGKGYKQEGRYDVQSAVAGSADGRDFAAHYLMLQHNLRVRVGDMKNNVITDVVVDSKSAGKKQKPVTLHPNWDDALAGARLLLLAKLQGGEAAPGIHDVGLAHTAVAATGGDLGELRKMGLLTEEGKKSQQKASKVGAKDGAAATTYSIGKMTPAKTPGNKPMSFNFGINHIRSILYIEWRAFDELKRLAQAPQQNPQQVAQVVQQLVAVGDGGGGD